MLDYFETKIISNKHDRFIYPLRWLIFCAIFFSLPLFLFQIIIFVAESKEVALSFIAPFALFLLGLLLINGLLKVISQQFFRKGTLLISKDYIKIIAKNEKIQIHLSEVKQLTFRRRSNFHKDDYHFNIRKEHGNTLRFIDSNYQSKLYEFQIHSKRHSKEFDRLIGILKNLYGQKIEFTSI